MYYFNISGPLPPEKHITPYRIYAHWKKEKNISKKTEDDINKKKKRKIIYK